MAKRWFSINLHTLNQNQLMSYFNIPEKETLLAYFDECLLDIQGKLQVCHLVLMSHSLLVIYEDASAVKVIDVGYKKVRKVHIMQDE